MSEAVPAFAAPRPAAGTGRGVRRIPLLAAAAFACVLMVTAWGLFAIHRELTEAALDRRNAMAGLAAATLAEKFDRVIDVATSLATRVRFRDLIEAGRWSEAAQILRDAPQTFGFIERIGLFDAQGALLAEVPDVSAARRPVLAERDWFRAALAGTANVSAVFRRQGQPQRNVFAVAAPIRSGAGAPLGVLAMQVPVDGFFGWLRGVDAGEDGVIYVTDPAGGLAYHPSIDVRASLVDFSSVHAVREALQGRRGVEVSYNNIENVDRVAAYAPVAKHGWAVVVAEPTGEVFESRNRLLAGAVAADLLILAFFGAYLSARVARQRERDARVRERTAELQALNHELDDLYDNAPCGYHSVDAEGRIRRINRTWLSWLGHAREEVVGRMHPDLMTPASAERFRREVFPRFLAEGRLDDVEFEYRRKDGSTFMCSLSATAVRDAEGGYVSSRSTVFDITERKRTEDRIRALNAALEDKAAELAAANKELESFSYSVSHDLRAPLRGVAGFADALIEDHCAELTAEAQRKVGIIRDEGRRMGVLIDELLAFSRLGRKALQRVDLDMEGLARASLEGLCAQDPGLAARVEIGALPRAHGDRVLLGQVWTNLLSNALKFSSKADRPRVVVSAVVDGKECAYCVRDNGAGFDPRYQAKLFGVFQRLHDQAEFPGTGVGLALVQRIVARHGGRVWAEGKPGEGAAFHFTLPKETSDGAV